MHIALLEPEIPPNTGNVSRTAAATGATLHLIGKLGFRLDDRSLRRAGCDYWDAVVMKQHDSLEQFENWVREQELRLFVFSARATTLYTQVAYQPGDVLLFGNESHGLPDAVLQRHAQRALRIPQPTGKVRSLNLATVVGIAVYEALRQCHGW